MDGDQVNQAGDQDQGTQDSLGWRAALSDEFKEHEFVKTFTKPTDFVKSALEIKTERDSLKTKLGEAIFKPGENAKPEEIAAYRKALGVPESPDEYEFPKGEDVEHDENMISWAKGLFHKVGLTKEQGSVISQSWDGFIKGLVEAENAEAEKAKSEAETKLKGEWGADYTKNVELTRRAYKHFGGDEFAAFLDESGMGNNAALIKVFYAVGKAMGEDWSPQGQQQRATAPKEGIIYDKSPAPPKNQ
jgi:hypothetical protein